MKAQHGVIVGFLGLVLAAQSCADIGGYDTYDGNPGTSSSGGDGGAGGGGSGGGGSGGSGGAEPIPSCTDGAKNGLETDVDCGGSCKPCSNGSSCCNAMPCGVEAGSNCESGVCNMGACAPALCDDTVKNGTETDVDCGGPHCANCEDMQACIGPADCASGVCSQGTCIAPTCDDGVQNGDEVDVDCGDQACTKPCENSKHCGSDDDCESYLCLNSTCQIPECTDGVKNGKETDIDCGGADCDDCELDQICSDADDCTTKFCTPNNKCATKVDGALCSDKIECNSGQCVDGVCCESACDSTCRVCNAQGKCVNQETNVMEMDCLSAGGGPCGNTGYCDVNGTCAKASSMTPCGEPKCSNDTTSVPEVKCDGVGNCPMPMPQQCAPFLCDTVSKQCTTGCTMDTDCASNAYCNAMMGMMGTCVAKQADGTQCTENRVCQKGFCVDGVCCESACQQTCRACNVPLQLGGCVAVPLGQPDPSAMTACTGDNVCNGTLNTPQPCLLANGKTCTMGTQCASGICVDGVCCDTACTDTCKACSTAKTGKTNGSCQAITLGTDPDNECSNQAPLQCQTGNCNGQGACQLQPAGTTCVPQTCSGSTRANADTCNATGTCVDNGTTSCGLYMCDTATPACRTSCTLDTHCISTHYCSASTCVAKKANGATCSGDSQCTSNFCVDGVCCNSACNTACRVCNAMGSVGTCSNITSGEDTSPANICAVTQTCDSLGVCKFKIGQPCTMGSQCITGTCSSGTCT